MLGRGYMVKPCLKNQKGQREKDICDPSLAMKVKRRKP